MTGIALLALLVWASYGLACVGVGYLVLGAVPRERPEVDSYQAFWVGLTVTAGVCEAYSLFRRMDAIPMAVLLGAGAIGLGMYWRSVKADVCRADGASGWAKAGMAVILGLLALRSAGPCTHYDTGLYGASAVRWLVKFPTVPGLANLHGRLGFNSTLFPSVAALYAVGLGSFAYRVTEGLLVAVLLVAICAAIERIARGDSNKTSDWFAALLAVPAVYWAAKGNLVGTDTDIPATVCCLAGAILLLRDLEEREPDANKQPSRFFAASVVFLLAVTLKLSALVFAVACMTIYLVRFRGRKQAVPGRRRVFVATAVVVVLLLGPWLARGYLLSGYPLYPEAALRLPAGWQVDPGSVRMVEAGVKSWAKTRHVPSSRTQGMAWVKPWFRGVRRQRIEFEVPAGLLLLGLAVLLLRARKARRQTIAPGLLLLVPAVAGIIFWFFTAPDPRFGAASIWVAAAYAGGSALCLTMENASARMKRMALAGIACLAIWCLYPRTLWMASFAPVLRVESTNPFPRVETETHQTSSGLAVRVPVKGDQCWDTPLPCTPYFNDKLELRNRQKLADGFRSAKLPDGAEWILENPAPQDKTKD